MKYPYRKDLQAAILPGSRHWVCALRLNPAMTRYVRNLPPTYVEACITRDPSDEQEARRTGGRTAYIVPVTPDGSLDWGHVSGLSELYWYGNKIQCVSRYNGLISMANTAMDKRIKDIEARRKDMMSRAVDYDVPDGC